MRCVFDQMKRTNEKKRVAENFCPEFAANKNVNAGLVDELASLCLLTAQHAPKRLTTAIKSKIIVCRLLGHSFVAQPKCARLGHCVTFCAKKF